jgi:hypothetical protein
MMDTSTVSLRSAAATAARRHDAVTARCEVRDLEALALELLAGVEHGLVLRARGDDVTSAITVETGDALDREVVRFGGARGPDDLGRMAAHRGCELHPGLLHEAARLASGHV